ncbi:glycosyltransferase family 2 protein [Sutcliffiella horikoshii]|uniref:Glycosyltransferase family 2 protein n=1 Tax=Sutcliffiella horikoshii TaxID=79883 RepID=A0A5D4T1D1_9BACI|nr:glycosyltransferase family 2 protein [Sutcliffiella horikoshii]TYS69500.1 glycosyltransferase family 2 protein [Sutcliffiella horikoshii]
MLPLVSVIIPTYNRFTMLSELMEALVLQTRKDFEVIVINDGGGRVDSLKEYYPELDLTIIDLTENVKHVQARNIGVSFAKGEYIMLIDDDDLIVPTHLETMIEKIKNVDLVYSDVEIVQYVRKNGVREAKNRHLFAYALDLDAMRKFSTFVPSGCLYRSYLHDRIGKFDPQMKNYWDWDFFLRVSEKFNVARSEVAGVLYDFSEENSNQSKDLSSMRCYLDRLSEKHNLGELETKNFWLLLEEPEVKKREAPSKIIWNGMPFISKLQRLGRLEEA